MTAEGRLYAAHKAMAEANAILARIVSAANKGPLEGEDGFILGYQMTPGPIHAAIPFLQKRGIVVTLDGEVRGVPKPTDTDYAEFEDWEQEMSRHQPVLSMADGSIVACQCLDRVFPKGEDWGTHLATIITARVTAHGESSDAQVLAGLNAFYAPDGYPRGALSHWSEGSIRAMRAALRAARDAQ